MKIKFFPKVINYLRFHKRNCLCFTGRLNIVTTFSGKSIFIDINAMENLLTET